jgi:hypothetical protein
MAQRPGPRSFDPVSAGARDAKSDEWLAAGCDRSAPLLARECDTLVASYFALRRAIATAPDK